MNGKKIFLLMAVLVLISAAWIHPAAAQDAITLSANRTTANVGDVFHASWNLNIEGPYESYLVDLILYYPGGSEIILRSGDPAVNSVSYTITRPGNLWLNVSVKKAGSATETKTVHCKIEDPTERIKPSIDLWFDKSSLSVGDSITATWSITAEMPLNDFEITVYEYYPDGSYKRVYKNKSISLNTYTYTVKEQCTLSFRVSVVDAFDVHAENYRTFAVTGSAQPSATVTATPVPVEPTEIPATEIPATTTPLPPESTEIPVTEIPATATPVPVEPTEIPATATPVPVEPTEIPATEKPVIHTTAVPTKKPTPKPTAKPTKQPTAESVIETGEKPDASFDVGAAYTLDRFTTHLIERVKRENIGDFSISVPVEILRNLLDDDAYVEVKLMGVKDQVEAILAALGDEAGQANLVMQALLSSPDTKESIVQDIVLAASKTPADQLTAYALQKCAVCEIVHNETSIRCVEIRFTLKTQQGDTEWSYAFIFDKALNSWLFTEK